MEKRDLYKMKKYLFDDLAIHYLMPALMIFAIGLIAFIDYESTTVDGVRLGIPFWIGFILAISVGARIAFYKDYKKDRVLRKQLRQLDGTGMLPLVVEDFPPPLYEHMDRVRYGNRYLYIQNSGCVVAYTDIERVSRIKPYFAHREYVVGLHWEYVRGMKLELKDGMHTKILVPYKHPTSFEEDVVNTIRQKNSDITVDWD